ncbi:MAG TPA: helix-turn-helix transcriptional regulator, partial [Spongiibacteraceae bacterium]|nr:helix-turn-helix transcriptional regulator [Spongiibacteraceae bacterium]
FSERWSEHRFRPIGSLYVLPPGQTVRARGDCNNHSSIVCDFEPEAIDAWFEGDVRWTDRRLEAMLDIANPNLRASLRRLGDEMRNPGFASAAVCELLAAQVAIDSARHCRAIDAVKNRGGLSPWKLKAIDERLAEIGAAPSLQELAELCHLSVRQLTRGFRVSRGCSIGEYIAQNRLEHAKRLLAGSASVKEVAYSLGFATPANFSTTFRRAMGETPRQFRERVSR